MTPSCGRRDVASNVSTDEHLPGSSTPLSTCGCVVAMSNNFCSCTAGEDFSSAYIRANPRRMNLFLRLDLLSLSGCFQRALRLGHALGIENFRNFLFAQQLLLSRNFNYGTAGGHRLFGDLRRLGIADVRVERGGQRYRALRVKRVLLFVGGDALHAALG